MSEQTAVRCGTCRWREVAEFPRYEVSEDGRVRNSETGLVLKQGIEKKRGYRYVSLSNRRPRGARRKPGYRTVHRLVALAFLPPPPSDHQVNHIDGDKGNNAATNLEWVTAKENRDHAVMNGLAYLKFTDNQVRMVAWLMKKRGWTGSMIQGSFGMDCSHAYKIVKGRSRTLAFTDEQRAMYGISVVRTSAPSDARTGGETFPVRWPWEGEE